MTGIAVFLSVIAAAGGFAVWNDRRTPWRDAPRERLEPRFPIPSL